MDLQLKNKVVVISGGARGIGEGIVRTFAEEGAIPVILDRDRVAGESLAAELRGGGQRADFLAVDLTSEDEVRVAMQKIVASFGGLDILVNNAGQNDAVDLRRSPADFVASLQRNLVHCFTLTHFALEALIERQGTIVNIGSKAAETGQGGTSGYAAAKGGLNALTREWAVDLAKFGIRVNCVVPAEVLTPQYQEWLDRTANPRLAVQKLNDSIPFARRTTTVEEIARTVAFVASPCSSHTTGQILHVDGGYVHLDRACTAGVDHLVTTELLVP